jgi:hypothetical protein
LEISDESENNMVESGSAKPALTSINVQTGRKAAIPGAEMEMNGAFQGALFNFD